MKRIRNQEGLTLIELAIVIAIIAILALLASAGPKLMETSKVETTCDHFDQIYSAAIQWEVRNAQYDFTGISSAVLQPYLVNLNLTTGALWGGGYTVSASSPASTLSVSVSNLPTSVTADIVTKLNSRGWTASASGSTVTATKGA